MVVTNNNNVDLNKDMKVRPVDTVRMQIGAD